MIRIHTLLALLILGCSGCSTSAWPQRNHTISLNKRYSYGRDVEFIIKRTDDQRFAVSTQLYDLLEVYRNGRLVYEEPFDRCFDFALLEAPSEFPVIECWSRGGGGAYSRSITQVVDGRYHMTKIERFQMDRSVATQPQYTVMPEWLGDEGDGKLYFVEREDRTPMPNKILEDTGTCEPDPQD